MASLRSSPTAAVLALGLLLSGLADAKEKPQAPVGVVIVYLGGPEAGGEGQKLIDQLIAELGAAMGLAPGALVGSYFTENAPAVEKLAAQPDSFVLGSLGFFLAQRQKAGLLPLARLKTTVDGTEQFHILVKKGRYQSLAELEGKVLCGSPLYEDPKFLDAIVFGGKLQAARYFKLEPTTRPLSAVRKLDKEQLDAVLLNTVQFESLRRLPLFDKLAELFVSEPMPALGLMVVDTPRTRAVKDQLLQTLLGLCGTPQGKSVCGNFGITGFEPLDEAPLAKVIGQYDAAK